MAFKLNFNAEEAEKFVKYDNVTKDYKDLIIQKNICNRFQLFHKEHVNMFYCILK